SNAVKIPALEPVVGESERLIAKEWKTYGVVADMMNLATGMDTTTSYQPVPMEPFAITQLSFQAKSSSIPPGEIVNLKRLTGLSHASFSSQGFSNAAALPATVMHLGVNDLRDSMDLSPLWNLDSLSVSKKVSPTALNALRNNEYLGDLSFQSLSLDDAHW